MSLDPHIPVDPALSKVVPASLGALVSLRFIPGTLPERILMTIGGTALAYYASAPAAAWLNMKSADEVGLVGFVIGLFGMTLVSKLYEVIQAMDAKALGVDLWAAVKKRFGIGA